MGDLSNKLETYHALVETIYDASLDSARWEVFLEQLTMAMNSHAAVFRLYDPKTMTMNFATAYGHDWEYIQSYHDYYAALDPTLPAFEDVPIGQVMDRGCVISDRMWSKTEAYNDFCRKWDVFHFMGCYGVKEEGRILRLGVHRSKQAGAFTDANIRLVKLLNPHLRRAFSISGIISTLRSQCDTVKNTLDHIDMAVILVDRSARPVLWNRTAENLFTSSNGLTISRGELRTCRVENTHKLHQLIAEATKVNGVPEQGGALRISCNSDPEGCELSMLVSPLNQEGSGPLGQLFNQKGAAAVVFVSQHRTEQGFSIEVLKGLYGLTQTEARLVRELAGGKQTTKISTSMKISFHTLRAHLKSIYRKTGAHSQVELIHLVLTGPVGKVIQ